MGAEARALGHGGSRVVARAARVREATVSQGAAELDQGGEPLGRIRRAGGGRKRLADLDPGVRPALLALLEPDERGDPMSPLRWTTKSLRALSAELSLQIKPLLQRAGHTPGPPPPGALPSPNSPHLRHLMA
jgi:Rhodopirellula transposase DDE domain